MWWRITSPTKWTSVDFELIATDSMLLAYTTEHNHVTHTMDKFVSPYDRYRELWLDRIQLPVNVPGARFVDFVGPLSFRLMLQEKVDQSDNQPMAATNVHMLTCTFSDDMRKVFVVKKELLGIVEQTHEWLKVFYTNGIPGGFMISIEGRRQVIVYELRAQLAVEVGQSGVPNYSLCHTYYYFNRKFFFVGSSSFENMMLFSFDLDTQEKRPVAQLAFVQYTYHLGSNGKLFVCQSNDATDWLLSVYDVAADCDQPPAYSIKLNCAGVLKDIMATPCGNAVVKFVDKEEHSFFWLWTNPPKLGEVALAALRQHMPEKTKSRLRAVNAPLLGYSRFVETLISCAI